MSKSPTPTKVLQLTGGYRKDRHAGRAGEVEPEPGFPEPPEWLLPEALAEWKRLAADSAYREAICLVDRAMLAMYCELWGRFVEGEKTGDSVKAAHIAVMTKIGAKFGLNPVDRVRVKTRAAERPVNQWELLKNSGKTNHAK